MFYVVRSQKGYVSITPSIDNMTDYLLIGYTVIGYAESILDADKIKKGKDK